MIIIAVIDDNKGMMFNGRRLSQDRVLREHIIRETKGKILRMSPYSTSQFQGYEDYIETSNDFLFRASAGEYCFVEGYSFQNYRNEIEKIILYHWNQNYPADVFFDFDLSDWTLVNSKDFVGYSHPKITEEVYIHEKP